MPPSSGQVILEQARRADPLTHPWGLYLSPAQGDADGLAWFSSEAALVSFVKQGLWSALSGVEAQVEFTAELTELLGGPSPLHWDRLEAVNLLLEPVGQMHWWGSLQQLYEGEDPFAKDLREAWRDQVGRGPQDFSALPAADARAFCDFLQHAFSA